MKYYHEVKGNNYERGYKIGELLKDSIITNYENQIRYYKETIDCDFAQWKSRVEDFMPFVEKYAPNTLEEIKGMADGSGLDIETILAVTTAYEKAADCEKKIEKCTSFAITQKSTSTGDVIFGQTNDEDYMEWISDLDVVIKHIDEKGFSTLLYTHPGIPAYFGMNSDLGILWTYIDNGERKVGLPTNIMIREVLHCTNLNDAIEYLKTVPHSIPNQFTLVHKSQGIASVECFPSNIYVENNESHLCHANHILNENELKNDVMRNTDEDNLTTFNRLRIMQNLVEKNIGKIDIDVAKSFLSDHTDSPFSICVHPHHAVAEPTVKTLAALVFNISKGELHIAFGNACRTPYNIYKI